MLDSELLGEVWLAMTRGQDSLLGEAPDDAAGASAGAAGTRRRFDASGLPVIQVDALALQAHEAYLDGLDKATGKPCLWRRLDGLAETDGAAG